ncbi:alpha/beta hydrolase [Paraburkholderia sp. EG285A]|uniref:alpha/beta hydrolase n=1 Tax=Paraburkholderia sp. EG285A TaxID=3237009 RepID=UPI0034D1F0E5
MDDLLDPELLVAARSYQTIDLLDVEAARRADSAAVAQVQTSDVPGLVPEATEIRNLTVPGIDGSPSVRIRTYSPIKRTHAEVGGLLFIHGGAFCAGDLETDHLRCLAYSQRAQIVVINVEYRLAPEHPYPAAFSDCCRVFEWIVENSAVLGVDPSAIGVGGESAGGALAAAVVSRYTATATRPACLVLLFPVLDHRMETSSMKCETETPAWNSFQTALMWELYLGNGAQAGMVSPSASPALLADLRGLPSTLLITAGLDPLRDEGIEFGVRLADANVHVQQLNYPGGFHVFDFAVPKASISQHALRRQIQFLQSALGSNDA